MNRYLKEFLHRGMLFAGFGPVILGIVYAILQRTVAGFSLKGGEVLLGIVSIYLLAFVQAGASVFNQIEEWPLPKSLFCHLGSLYLVYSVCYLVNTWIPFEPMVLLIFTGIFLAIYFAVWLTVYLIVKSTGQKMTKKLK